VGRYAGGQWDAALRFPLKLEDGATAGGAWRFAINNTGGIVWISGTDKGDTRVYLTQGGKHQPLCTYGVTTSPTAAIDGKTVFSCDDFALDDSGRVLLRLHFQGDGAQHLYSWNQGVWTPAVLVNRTTVKGQVISGVNILRAMGMHIEAGLNTPLGTFIAEWADSGWAVRYGPNDVMPTGTILNTVNNYLEVNASGDIAFVNGQNSGFGVYSQRSGSLSTVMTTARPTDDGDYLVNILGLDLRDDGTIYLLAMNQYDELVLYSATPKSN
jgi:hypothetical protein